MKTSFVAVLGLVAAANAFPSIARQVAEQNAKRQAVPGTVPFPSIGGIPRPKGSVPFNEEQQFVSTSGEHRVSSIALSSALSILDPVDSLPHSPRLPRSLRPLRLLRPTPARSSSQSKLELNSLCRHDFLPGAASSSYTSKPPSIPCHSWLVLSALRKLFRR